jgi:hypothetical protein
VNRVHSVTQGMIDGLPDRFGQEVIAVVQRNEAGYLKMLEEWSACGCVSTVHGTVCPPAEVRSPQ